MKKNDTIKTPRFCTVRIEEVYPDKTSANEAGYTEPTYYRNDGYVVLGKSIDLHHMVFAAYKED